MRTRLPGSNQWVALNMVAIDNFPKMQINLMHILSGAGAPGKDEVLLEMKVLTVLNVSVGDTLEFELYNGSIQTMKVAVIVSDPSTGAGDFLAQPFAYITTSTLSYLHQPDTFNRMYVTLTTGQTTIKR